MSHYLKIIELSSAENISEKVQVIVTPDLVEADLGEAFTLTVNITNVRNLYAWQMVLKYNGSIINCTAIWIPANNVFAGNIVINVEPIFDKDYKDGLNFVIYACSLVTGSVSVQNGVLFKANFTVIGEGATKVGLATEDKPAFRDQFTSFKSLIMDEFGKKITFSHNYSLIKVKGVTVNLKPVARFSAYIAENIDEEKYIVIKGPKPIESIPYIHAYKGYPVVFNASESFDPDGRISAYVWDFGDGNIIITDRPVITYVYNKTGQVKVKLVVRDSGEPPLESDPVYYIVVVGLILERYNWFPIFYGFLSCIVVVLAIYLLLKKPFIRAKSMRREKKLINNISHTVNLIKKQGKSIE